MDIPLVTLILLLFKIFAVLGVESSDIESSSEEIIKKLQEDVNAIRGQCEEAQVLKATVAQLQGQIDGLLKQILPFAATARTCEELKLTSASLPSGMYWVDPDGHGTGDSPIYVFCNMTSGSTSVLHDSEDPTDVGHCWDSGCYSRNINYRATMRQMIALSELSEICTQFFQYECKSAPLEFNGIPQSWWTDREGIRHYDFTGGNSTQSRCQCSLEEKCMDPELTCNCNSVSPLSAMDTGLITDKTLLPITKLNFGRILTPPASGSHTLGRFQCFGRVFTSPQKPRSCQDLWRSGHTISGFYNVQDAADIEMVYCDMTTVPGQGGNVASIKHGTLVERITMTESLIRDQTDRTNSLNLNLDRLNGTVEILSQQGQTFDTQIRKLESSGNRLNKDVRALSISRKRQGAELAELKNKTSGVPLSRMPTSCRDLWTIGHKLSGIYTIKGSKQIEMVHCDMTQTGIQQTRVGSVDVKSSPVHFYVLRNMSLYLEDRRPTTVILTFQVERSNVGGGMQARTGIFTAPKAGTYVFHFGGIKRDRAKHVNVFLYLNDTQRVGSVYGSQHEGYFTLSMQSILQLKAGDTVKLVMESLSGGGIYDDKDLTTHFTGFLLEEELF